MIPVKGYGYSVLFLSQSQTHTRDRNNGFFTYKFSSGNNRDGNFFALFGNDGELNSPLLKIEGSVCQASLRKELLLGFQLDDLSSQSSFSQILRNAERRFWNFSQVNLSLPSVSWLSLRFTDSPRGLTILNINLLEIRTYGSCFHPVSPCELSSSDSPHCGW